MPSENDIIKAINALPEKKRVSSFDFEGQKIWVKRPETIRHWRDAYKKLVNPGFQNEVKSLLFLNKMNAPTPKVLASGKDFLALADAGPSAKSLIKQPEMPLDEKHELLFKSGYTLGRLHTLNLAHGRPLLRDICWNGETMCLIDFERHSGKLATDWQKKQDVLIFIHGLLLLMPPSDQGVQNAINGYMAAGAENTFKAAIDVACRLAWLLPFLRTIQPVAGRDLGLVVPTLELLINMKDR